MKTTRPHPNVSKVKRPLPGDAKGTAHQFELRKDVGLVITFLPGKGNHKTTAPPRTLSFERLAGLRVSAPLPVRFGTPAEECLAAQKDLEYLGQQFAQGHIEEAVVSEVREQLRRVERVLGKL